VGGHNKAGPVPFAQRIAAAGLILSGLVHLALTPDHLREAPILGLGFFGVAILQLALGGIFTRRRSPGLWPAALLLTIFSLTVYLISRTSGLPFGHEQGPEAISPIDLISKVAELVTGTALLVSIHTTTRPWPRGRSLRLAPFNRYAYLLVLVCMGVVFALIALDTGTHLAPHGEEHSHGAARSPVGHVATGYEHSSLKPSQLSSSSL
jgi:hypothetical protein